MDRHQPVGMSTDPRKLGQFSKGIRETTSLEQLIKSQYNGEEVSSGTFSIDREKALEKIAKFQLPHPDAWTIKLAQGAVLSGADALKISQTRTETVFTYKPGVPFEFDFMSSFIDSSDEAQASWQATRAGLWAVALNLRRPFTIAIQGRRFFWDGDKIREIAEGLNTDVITIAVSHRTQKKGKGNTSHSRCTGS